MWKPSYMTRLRLAAHWMLPPCDAAEVIADYQDILTRNPRPAPVLRHDLGDPVQAVRMLTDEKSYRQWKIVFTVLVLTLVLPAFSIRTALGWVILYQLIPDIWIFGHRVGVVDMIFPVGLMVSLWFWGKKRDRPVRTIPKAWGIPLFLLPLAVIGMILWQNALFVSFDPRSLYTVMPDGGIIGESYLVNQGRAVADGWELVCYAAALTGLVGLFRARTTNHRWRAFYIQGLTAVCVCHIMFRFYNGLNLTDGVEPYWRMCKLRAAVMLLLGCAGTVYALLSRDTSATDDGLPDETVHTNATDDGLPDEMTHTGGSDNGIMPDGERLC